MTPEAGVHPVPCASAGHLFCGFHRMVLPGAVQLGHTAGVAGIQGRGKWEAGDFPQWANALEYGSRYQRWGGLQGWVVGASLGEFLRRGRQQSGHACVPFLASFTYLVPQALTFIIFICFTASISAYMAAALLEFFITLAFLFLYATQYYQRFDRLNWPCLVRDPASPTTF